MRLRKMMGVAMTLAALALSGCVTRPVLTTTELGPCKGDRCVQEYRGPVYAGGGGRLGVAFYTERQRDGSVVTRPAVNSSGPDRFDTLLPPLIMGMSHVWATSIQADAMRDASKHSGPNQVFVLAPQGGNAQAINETQVDVTTDQNLGVGLQPVHFCDTCNTGD